MDCRMCFIYTTVSREFDNLLGIRADRLDVSTVASRNIPRGAGYLLLTRWGRDKMGDILETAFSNSFHSMKVLVASFQLSLNMFPVVELIIRLHWLGYWVGTEQTISHYLKQRWLCLLTDICATLPRGVKALKHWPLGIFKCISLIENVVCYLKVQCSSLRLIWHWFGIEHATNKATNNATKATINATNQFYISLGLNIY